MDQFISLTKYHSTHKQIVEISDELKNIEMKIIEICKQKYLLPEIFINGRAIIRFSYPLD